jgi:hypothetical protein
MLSAHVDAVSKNYYPHMQMRIAILWHANAVNNQLTASVYYLYIIYCFFNIYYTYYKFIKTTLFWCLIPKCRCFELGIVVYAMFTLF